MRLDLVDDEIGPADVRTSVSDGLARLLGWMCAALLKLVALSWRSDRSALRKIDRTLADGTCVVAAFWHGSYLPLFALAAGRPVTVFTSRSFRGKIIASICRAYGYRPNLLPPGQRGYHTMRHVLTAQAQQKADPWIVAIAIDGPLGPARKVKSGALYLAARTGAVIMPIAVSSRPSLSINSRWDSFEIPLPWAKIDLAVGGPISLPTGFGHNHQDILKAKQKVLDCMAESDA